MRRRIAEQFRRTLEEAEKEIGQDPSSPEAQLELVEQFATLHRLRDFTQWRVSAFVVNGVSLAIVALLTALWIIPVSTVNVAVEITATEISLTLGSIPFVQEGWIRASTVTVEGLSWISDGDRDLVGDFGDQILELLSRDLRH